MNDERTIHDGCTVTVRCIAHDEQQQAIDDGQRPLRFTVGRGEVIDGIDRAVRGRRAGERWTLACLPEAAYGPYRPELVFEAVRENLPPDLPLEAGTVIESGGGRFPLKVIEVTPRGARLDGNHPLAGKTLHFDLEILLVETAE
jgi:FKBP-type peptidyl-prolyl cis-trans isomerase SlyD